MEPLSILLSTMHSESYASDTYGNTIRMVEEMKKIAAIFVCLLFLASALGISAVVLAAPPDKCEPWPECKDGGEEPPPAGTVYFRSAGAVWTMNVDGSEKTELGIYPGIDQSSEAFGDVSRLEHGGHYWFMRFEVVGGNYPDGPLVREIFAVRDDGTVEVQLTDDPTLATYHRNRALVWGIDDNTVTWSAKRWGADPVMPEEFGIYSAAISFDANGDVIGLSEEPTLIWDTGYHLTYGGDYVPNVMRIDWSPDGSQIVLAKTQHNDILWELFVVDLGAQTETYLGTSGYMVRWSPDGSKIAFVHYKDLRTINPDGTDEQILVAPSDRGKYEKTVQGEIDWSPDSSHLVYTWRLLRYSAHTGNIIEGRSYVYRVEANGDNPTSMIDGAGSHAWR